MTLEMDRHELTNGVMTPWVIVTFDTLLKIASPFSSAVVRGTHGLLLAKSQWAMLRRPPPSAGRMV
jgi:hypothetical protein